MSNSESKNSIFKKIRAALNVTTRLPFPNSEGNDSVFQPLQQDVVVEFAEQFTQLQGKFAYCLNTAELWQSIASLVTENEWKKIFCDVDEWRKQLQPNTWTDDIITCDASITGCEALVARTGSIVLSSKNSGRITSVYAPVHICIAYTSQLVYDIKDAFIVLNEKYNNQIPSSISFATGPSRTADIEKTLVVGVHGPKEVYLFLVDDENAL